MGNNYDKEFFEHFDKSSAGQSQEALFDLDTENAKQDEFEELGELILRFQDGVLSQKQFTRMQNWLLSDNRAVKYYVDYVYLCAGLTILLNKKRESSFLDRFFAIK